MSLYDSVKKMPVHSGEVRTDIDDQAVATKRQYAATFACVSTGRVESGCVGKSA